MKNNPVLHFVVIVFAASCLLLSAIAAASDDDAKKTAVTAAEQWIALIDAGEYAASWDEASEVYQSAVGRSTWAGNMPLIRDPLGDVLSRSLGRVSFVQLRPGAPAGRDAVIRFRTTYRNFASATETVMLVQGGDGRWRVMGYYITSGLFDMHGALPVGMLLALAAMAWYLEIRAERAGRPTAEREGSRS